MSGNATSLVFVPAGTVDRFGEQGAGWAVIVAPANTIETLCGVYDPGEVVLIGDEDEARSLIARSVALLAPAGST